MIRIKTFYLVGRNTCKLALAPLALAFHSQKIKNKVREPWIYLVTPLPLRGSIPGPRQTSSLLPPAPPHLASGSSGYPGRSGRPSTVSGLRAGWGIYLHLF